MEADDEITYVFFRKGEIRRLSKIDLAELDILMFQIFDNEKRCDLKFGIDMEDYQMTAQELRRHMSDADYVVLARAGRQIIGLTYADQGEYEYMDSATYIEYCVVLDTYRGRGIGKAMMDTLLDGCRENGVKTVVLHVNAENEKARALYNKAGYNTIGYVMAKNI